MAKGIVRKIDELGRITLPIETRRMFNLSAGEYLGLSLDGQVIHISTKTRATCTSTRPLDELGRICLPIEFRRTLSIVEKDPIDMWIDGEDICIQKVGCEWCSSVEELMEIGDHCLCRKCAYTVVDKVMEV